jgi:uncharacterized protein YbjT (DUF2867 family)
MIYPTDVCIAGSSGLVGGELLLILSHLDEVKTIQAISRSPLGKLPSKVENLIMDFDRLENKAEALKADIFICCLGSTIKKAGSKEAFRKVDFEYVLKFAKVAEQVKAQKLIVISAMGADAESKVFYNRTKGEMEEALYDLDIPQIEIVRPSLILGNRKEKRTGEEIAQKLSPYLNPLMIGPLKKYRPIEAKTIARAMAIAALNFAPGRFIYESDELKAITGQKS